MISVLISINESIIFNVNMYIDMKTKLKLLFTLLIFSIEEKEFICMHGSEFACMFTVKFVFINPTFCVGSGRFESGSFSAGFVRTQWL